LSVPPSRKSCRASRWVSRTIKEELRATRGAPLARGRHARGKASLGTRHRCPPKLATRCSPARHPCSSGSEARAKTRHMRSPWACATSGCRSSLGSEYQRRHVQPSLVACPQLTRARDETPIDWVHRDRRFGEKLATPDTYDRRPDRVKRPIKVAGAGTLRRAHHSLRAGAAHQPRHLRDQQSARPSRSDPGGLMNVLRSAT